ncbi:MAG: ATP-binding protein [Balneolaceae bacterium]
MKTVPETISFGGRRLVGQQKAREKFMHIVRSGRLGHAYLITGPDGSGKTAFALAMAEWINSVDNLTDFQGHARSRKSNWFTHPDIHLFIPLPATVGSSELQSRLQLLAEDPYNVVDFTLRPALNNADSSKNRRAFYPIEYFREEIRKVTVLKPNEGERTVVILTDIETMRKEAANAFLKMLEEPAQDVMFILTARRADGVLPTIASRCQQIRLQPLQDAEIADALIHFDDAAPDDAALLARMSGGHYALTRFYDTDALKESRDEAILFLRLAYTQDAPALLKLIQQWQSGYNTENQIALCNTLEMLLRDILVYRETGQSDQVVNADQLEVIQNFCASLQEARLHDMISHLQELKELLYQNVQFKLIFTTLSLRFGMLMRGLDPEIRSGRDWQHLPALTDTHS